MVEGLQREQLEKLGHDVKPLAPFFSKVRFRARTWRDTLWGSRAAEGRLVAPCTDVSKGYIIRVKDKDAFRLYATTLVYTGYREPEPSPDLVGSEEPVHKYEPTDFPKGRHLPKGHTEVHLLPEVAEAKAMPSTGASSSAGVRAINHAHDFAVGEVMPAPQQMVPSTRDHLVHGSKLVKEMNEQQLDQEAKLLCHCRPSKYVQSRTCDVLRAWCRLHQPCGMPVCTNGGEQSAPANRTCNVGRLVSQLLHAVLPDSCCEAVVMSASKVWQSRDLPSALQGPGWLLGIEPSYGGELWVQLQPGDKVQGPVSCHKDENGQLSDNFLTGRRSGRNQR